jgi:hypothetical protein
LEEWFAISSEIIKSKKQNHISGDDQEGNTLYPVLSRLAATESETFSLEEVKTLRSECLQAYDSSRAITTFRALNKLVIASNWAIALDRGLYFRGP